QCWIENAIQQQSRRTSRDYAWDHACRRRGLILEWSQGAKPEDECARGDVSAARPGESSISSRSDGAFNKEIRVHFRSPALAAARRAVENRSSQANRINSPPATPQPLKKHLPGRYRREGRDQGGARACQQGTQTGVIGLWRELVLRLSCARPRISA